MLTAAETKARQGLAKPAPGTAKQLGKECGAQPSITPLDFAHLRVGVMEGHQTSRPLSFRKRSGNLTLPVDRFLGKRSRHRACFFLVGRKSAIAQELTFSVSVIAPSMSRSQRRSYNAVDHQTDCPPEPHGLPLLVPKPTRKSGHAEPRGRSYGNSTSPARRSPRGHCPSDRLLRTHRATPSGPRNDAGGTTGQAAGEPHGPASRPCASRPRPFGSVPRTMMIDKEKAAVNSAKLRPNALPLR
ncbi:hypothetical protein SAMN04487953_11932 [Billgrantia desiderata]|nr:hypothetical protein SAMN04487953_11932 [Halomonas desiderata]